MPCSHIRLFCLNGRMFSELKVAHMATYFLLKCVNHKMPHMKLMKLLYLADRKALSLYDSSISGDCVVAMPHGPVLTMTLDYINGALQSSSNGWESFISDRADHKVSLRHKVSLNELDELSDSEISIIDDVWADFGHYDQWDLVDYTHEHCPEWTDPKGSSHPISFADIFKALGRSKQDAAMLACDIEAQSSVNELIASL